MNKCSADQTGLAGCNFSIKWTIKAADMKLFACGTHLNRVCQEIVDKGAEYMQVSVHED